MQKGLSKIAGWVVVRPRKAWESLGITWAELSKDWLPSDLQPPLYLAKGISYQLSSFRSCTKAH